MAQPAGPSTEQFQLIQRIRRGYSVEAPVEGRSDEAEEAIRDHVRTISAAAKLLSTELYSKPTHFVLELLQNADDCSYAAGVQPRVLLVIMHDAILHATNEVGFTAAEVKAICSLGRSTKSRRVGAFTGEKGIGFKATAVASEVTYISSAGYTFAFDMRPDAYEVPCLGLVCPRWEEVLQQRMQTWLEQRLQGTGATAAGLLDGMHTCMWLQLKPDVDQHKLSEELGLLDPYMLLNLRQLRDVTLLLVRQGGDDAAAADDSGSTALSCWVKRISRTDTDKCHVSIAQEQGLFGGSLDRHTRHLLCLREVLQVPPGITDEKRPDVEQVEVVFALPVTEDGYAAPDPHAQVFAFLPVRPYGFRFHLQADWILPSSREGVLESRTWNRWLQEQLGPTFVRLVMQAITANHQKQQQQAQAALQGQAQDPQLQPQQAATCNLSAEALLEFLPLPDDVPDEFMGHVSTAILEGLQQQPCVLTASGRLALAASTVIPSALLLRADGTQLISNAWLCEGLPGLEYVHPELLCDPEAERMEQVLLQLGSRRFSSSLLLDWLGSAGARRLLQAMEAESRAAWLSDLYGVCWKLTAQPAGSAMCLHNDLLRQQLLKSAPIVQLYSSSGSSGGSAGSSEEQQQMLLSVQELKRQGRQVWLWNYGLGSETDLQLLARTAAAAPSGAAAAVCAQQACGALGSSSSSSSLCLVDPRSLGPHGVPFMQSFLEVAFVPLSVVVQQVLLLQATGGLCDADQDALLLLLLRNEAQLSSKDLSLLQEQLQLRAEAPNSHSTGYSGGGSADNSTCSGRASSSSRWRLAKQLYLPLHASTHVLQLTPSLSENMCLHADLLAAGIPFVCPSYAALQGALKQHGTQTVWRLLQSFGVQCISLSTAAEHLLRLYTPDSSSGHCRIQLPAHMLHLEFLAQVPRSPVYLQQLQQLRLFSASQDPATDSAAGEAPGCAPWQLHWPLVATAGADAVTDQLCQLRGVSLVHPCYVQQQSAGCQLVQEISKALTPLKVWQHLLDMHQQQDLQQAAATVGLSLQQLLEQQLTYLAGVRLQLPCVNRAQPGLQLLDSSGQLVPSKQLYIPPEDAAALAVLQGLQASGSGLQLLHSCFVSHDPSSEPYLLLTNTLGVHVADKIAVIGAVVELHQQGSAAVSEDQRMQHLQYLAQHSSFLQQHKWLLQQVQQAVLLADAQGQYRRAAELHMPLGPQFEGLAADMCAAGMLFLHSRYTCGSSGSGSGSTNGCDSSDGNSSSVSGSLQQTAWLATGQAQQLLMLLGVGLSDANTIVQHILKLYTPRDRLTYPSVQQHLSHLAFVQEQWGQLQHTVQQQLCKSLPLLAVAEEATEVTAAAAAATQNSSSAPCSEGESADSDSDGCVYAFPAQGSRYALPAAGSPEQGLLPVLQLAAGSQFLHRVYSQHEGLLQWLQSKLGVSRLTPGKAAQLLLAAHSKHPSAVRKISSPEELAQQALYFALHAPDSMLNSCRGKLLLVVEVPGGGGSTQLQYRTAANGPALYLAAAGAGWELKQVLPPGTTYLHPAYTQLLQELRGRQLHEHGRLLVLLHSQLGLHMRPMVGSKAFAWGLRKWQPGSWEQLLRMLADEWGSYSVDEQHWISNQLRDVWVETSQGQRHLQDSFLPGNDMPANVRDLLITQLQLPVLQLHVRDSDGAKWGYLQRCGVHMTLSWQMFLKVLQHLSQSKASPALPSMQQLYNTLSALLELQQDAVGEVQRALATQRLIYVPAAAKQGGGKWLSSGEVFWSAAVGSKSLFPHRVFLDSHYKGKDGLLFEQKLGLANAGLQDLKGSLLHFAQQPGAEVHGKVLLLYELLARHAAELPWLADLISNQPVLLVQQGTQLSFCAATTSSSSGSSGSGAEAGAGRIYVPDNAALLELFQDDIRTLAVPLEKLPVLQPLLGLITPALPLLSASVQRSFVTAAAADGVEVQQEPGWTHVMRAALPLLARYLYYSNLWLFQQLLNQGWLQQLSSLHVFRVEGLVSHTTLGAVSKQTPTQAAAQMLPQQQLAQWLHQAAAGCDSTAQAAEANSSSAGSGDGSVPVLLVDAAACGKRGQLSAAVAAAYTDLLWLLAGSQSSSSSRSDNINGSSSSSGSSHPHGLGPSPFGPTAAAAARASTEQRLRWMLKDLVRGDVEDVEYELQQDGIGLLPPELDPWLKAAAAAAAGANGVQASGTSSDADASSEQDEESDNGDMAAAAAAAPLPLLPPAAVAAADADADYAAAQVHHDLGAAAAVAAAQGQQQRDAADQGVADSLTAQMQGLQVSGPKRRRRAGVGLKGIQPRGQPGTAAAPDAAAVGATSGQAGTTASANAAAVGQQRTASGGAAEGASGSQGLLASASGGVQGEQGWVSAWLHKAVSAAEAAANTEQGLQQLLCVPGVSNGQTVFSNMLARGLPRSWVVELPDGFAPHGVSSGGADGASSLPPPSAAAAGPGAAVAEGHGDRGQGDAEQQGGSSDAADDAQAGTAAAAALDGAAAASSSGGVSQVRSQHDEPSALMKAVGEVGELYVFNVLRQQLPGFDESCWHSGARRLIGAAEPEHEPPYDFVYVDTEGQLSGRQGAVCYIEVKATTADCGRGAADPRPFEISRRQWELAGLLHAQPEQGVFVVVRVHHVGSNGGPSIACIIRDPVQLLLEGRLWVTAEDKLLVASYPCV